MTSPTSRFDMLIGLICMGAVLLLVAIYKPAEEQPEPDVFVACFIGGEPIFSGPVRGITAKANGTVVIHPLPPGQRLELINGACLVMTAPD